MKNRYLSLLLVSIISIQIASGQKADSSTRKKEKIKEGWSFGAVPVVSQMGLVKIEILQNEDSTLTIIAGYNSIKNPAPFLPYHLKMVAL